VRSALSASWRGIPFLRNAPHPKERRVRSALIACALYRRARNAPHCTGIIAPIAAHRQSRQPLQEELPVECATLTARPHRHFLPLQDLPCHRTWGFRMAQQPASWTDFQLNACAVKHAILLSLVYHQDSNSYLLSHDTALYGRKHYITSRSSRKSLKPFAEPKWTFCQPPIPNRTF
jgi:hypothetical protein